MNSARFRHRLSGVYPSATRAGSREFQASSASLVFWAAVMSSKGGSGGRLIYALLGVARGTTDDWSADLARGSLKALNEMRAMRTDRIRQRNIGFAYHSPVVKLHDAHGIRRLAVIAQDKFGDPEVTAAD